MSTVSNPNHLPIPWGAGSFHRTGNRVTATAPPTPQLINQGPQFENRFAGVVLELSTVPAIRVVCARWEVRNHRHVVDVRAVDSTRYSKSQPAQQLSEWYTYLLDRKSTFLNKFYESNIIEIYSLLTRPINESFSPVFDLHYTLCTISLSHYEVYVN